MKKQMMTRLVAATASGSMLAGCGVYFAIDECDPSENAELGDMTTEELDALCGEDRSFRMGHE